MTWGPIRSIDIVVCSSFLQCVVVTYSIIIGAAAAYWIHKQNKTETNISSANAWKMWLSSKVDVQLKCIHDFLFECEWSCFFLKVVYVKAFEQFKATLQSSFHLAVFIYFTATCCCCSTGWPSTGEVDGSFQLEIASQEHKLNSLLRHTFVQLNSKSARCSALMTEEWGSCCDKS